MALRWTALLMLALVARGSSVPVIPDSQKLLLQKLINRQLQLQVEIERQLAAMQKLCAAHQAELKLAADADPECVVKSEETK